MSISETYAGMEAVYDYETEEDGPPAPTGPRSQLNECIMKSRAWMTFLLDFGETTSLGIERAVAALENSDATSLPALDGCPPPRSSSSSSSSSGGSGSGGSSDVGGVFTRPPPPNHDVDDGNAALEEASAKLLMIYEGAFGKTVDDRDAFNQSIVQSNNPASLQLTVPAEIQYRDAYVALQKVKMESTGSSSSASPPLLLALNEAAASKFQLSVGVPVSILPNTADTWPEFFMPNGGHSRSDTVVLLLDCGDEYGLTATSVEKITDFLKSPMCQREDEYGEMDIYDGCFSLCVVLFNESMEAHSSNPWMIPVIDNCIAAANSVIFAIYDEAASVGNFFVHTLAPEENVARALNLQQSPFPHLKFFTFGTAMGQELEDRDIMCPALTVVGGGGGKSGIPKNKFLAWREPIATRLLHCQPFMLCGVPKTDMEATLELAPLLERVIPGKKCSRSPYFVVCTI